MGKNLKGRECGKGICQRKDGKYSARYNNKHGRRLEKHFDTLAEARNWLADAKYNDRHDVITTDSEMTVEEWYTYWMGNLICDQHSPGDRCHAHMRCQAHALQSGLEPDGTQICRLDDPPSLHCNGNDVSGGCDERHSHKAPYERCEVYQTGSGC